MSLEISTGYKWKRTCNFCTKSTSNGECFENSNTEYDNNWGYVKIEKITLRPGLPHNTMELDLCPECWGSVTFRELHSKGATPYFQRDSKLTAW